MNFAGLRWWAAVWAVAIRPGLWPVALRETWRLAVPRWWRRWPPLPLPDPEYLQFRMQTAYGDAGTVAPPGDVVDFLKWCRRMERLGVSGGGGRGSGR